MKTTTVANMNIRVATLFVLISGSLVQSALGQYPPATPPGSYPPAGGYARPSGYPPPGGGRPVHGQVSGRPAGWSPQTGDQRRIVVGLPQAQMNARGELQVRPNVRVSRRGQPAVAGRPTRQRPTVQATSAPMDDVLTPFVGQAPEVMPVPYDQTPRPPETIFGSPMAESIEALPNNVVETVEPMFDSVLRTVGVQQNGPLHGLFRVPRRNPYADIGIGHERVMLAPFEIDISQPMGNFRLTFGAYYDHEFPDRSEYLWSSVRGPGADTGTDYQDVRMMLEAGGKKFSVQTEIPIRILDPDFLNNTAGMGDMTVTTKTVLIDGKTWQITQFLKTYMPTGPASHGLGTGHVSMEPGFLARIKYDDRTYIHTELKYWFPIAGDPNHSGQVLRYGIGFSHLWWETDATAMIPTLEFVGYTVLDGRKTAATSVGGILVNQGTPEVDGEVIFNVYPGLRYVWDNGGDLGLWEIGMVGGVALSQNHWYDSMMRMELRWSY